MKRLFSLWAGVLLAVCLTGCQKSQPVAGEPEEEFVENALVIKPADGSPSIVCPLGSAFSMGSLYVEPDTGRSGGALSYNFFSGKYTQYPLSDNSPMVVVSGVMFDDTSYVEPGDWISRISVRGLDRAFPQALVIIPVTRKKYEGGNAQIKDARIESFQKEDIRMVITTVAGDIITISFSGEVLPSRLM